VIWWKEIASGERIRPENDPLEVECLTCHTTFKLRIKHTQLRAWLDGADLQDAIPGLTKYERALLVIGYCGQCYEKQFPSGEHNWVH
jgi:hypothetical protein